MEEILKYFPDLSGEQQSRFEALLPLYKNWNEQINVISRKDIEELYIRHVLHSLAIAKLIQFKPYTEVLDVGTGGGFPGIPLAILFPEARFFLVDSIGKKIKVVQSIIDELGLENAKAQQTRMEQLDHSCDFIVCRAVARLEKLTRWTRKLIVKQNYNELANGWLLLKGGDLREEMAAVKGKKSLHQISDFFDQPFYEEKYVIHLAK